MEEKSLTMIEQHKEETFSLMLEDTISQFNRMERAEIRKFIKENYKHFNKLYSDINSGSDRIISKSVKFINEEKGIQCDIHNCEEIDKFAKTDLEITFKFFDKRNPSDFLIIRGSGELHGCTSDDADQFMKMIDDIVKPVKLNLLQKNL